MKFRLPLFIKEAFLFILTFEVVIYSASRIVKSVIPSETSIPVPDIIWGDIFWFAGIIILLYVGLRHLPRLTGIALNLLLILLVLSGSHIFLTVLLGNITGLAATLVVVLAFIFSRTVLIHNLALVLGLGGVASIVGLSFQPLTLVGALIVLSVYDILAVYWTRHMVAFARGMVQTGAIFGFIIPFTLKDSLSKAKDATGAIGERYMILGSGDIGLPAIFLGSIIGTGSLNQALIVGLASLIGLFITHLLFVNQSERRAMAALPPIAAASIIGYLIAQFM